ncbi:response regulator transcription factor [Teredinibacter purpureus]|uniref:response regulator transcription factor n=1 Tax=Teredinibacter purpureus TaxID=2731756 RepID=UPI0005F7AF10|nr:response regulator transcription factor [Teredinibacter purpureus]
MENTIPTILLVDDDIELCNLLAEYLSGEGFEAVTSHTGQDAITCIQSNPTISAVVLDIMMPGMSGLEVLRQIRPQSDIPIIMLTGRGDDIDRILGLEMGADDYLGKPCNPRELVARLRAILRRTHNQISNSPDQPLQLHGITLRISALSVHVNDNQLNLTSAEFNTLQLLLQKAGHTLSKQLLTEAVLHRKLEPYDRSIDVHISRLRQKLSAEGVGDVIKSVRGIGYQMVTE